MHGSPIEADKPITQKQSPTPATWSRSAIVTGGGMTLPFAFAEAIAGLFGLLHDFFPMITEPSDARCLAWGILITAFPTWWASFSLRGTEIRPDN